jgi:hypothetical protein
MAGAWKFINEIHIEGNKEVCPGALARADFGFIFAFRECVYECGGFRQSRREYLWPVPDLWRFCV